MRVGSTCSAAPLGRGGGVTDVLERGWWCMRLSREPFIACIIHLHPQSKFSSLVHPHPYPRSSSSSSCSLEFHLSSIRLALAGCLFDCSSSKRGGTATSYYVWPGPLWKAKNEKEGIQSQECAAKNVRNVGSRAKEGRSGVLHCLASFIEVSKKSKEIPDSPKTSLTY